MMTISQQQSSEISAYVHVNQKENKVLLALFGIFIIIISRFPIVISCLLLYFRTKNLEPMQINLTNIMINQGTNKNNTYDIYSIKNLKSSH